jgi:hypothetical protein
VVSEREVWAVAHVPRARLFGRAHQLGSIKAERRFVLCVGPSRARLSLLRPIVFDDAILGRFCDSLAVIGNQLEDRTCGNFGVVLRFFCNATGFLLGLPFEARS